MNEAESRVEHIAPALNRLTKLSCSNGPSAGNFERCSAKSEKLDFKGVST